MTMHEICCCENLSQFLRLAQRRLQIRTQGEMAAALGMSESTYKARLKDPSELKVRDLWIILRVGKRAGLDLKEVEIL